MFSAVLKAAGESPLATLARLDVPELGRLVPNILICDVDATATDSLELLRQIRFVLPECLIAVYSYHEAHMGPGVSPCGGQLPALQGIG